MPVVVGSGSGGGGGSGVTLVSLSDLSDRIRLELEDEPMETVANNGGVVSSGATSFTVTDGTIWAAGRWGSWDDGTDEDFLVRSVATNLLTVKPGHHHTTESPHATDAVILLEPRFRPYQITKAITTTLNDLWPKAWTIATQTISPTSGTFLYEANSDVLDLVSASQLITSSPDVFASYGVRRNYDGLVSYPIALKTGLSTSLYSSGMAWYLPSLAHATNDIEVTYRAKISTTTVESGLMEDVVVWGACYRLVAAKTVPRGSDDFGGNDNEAGVLDILRPASYYQNEYDNALQRLHFDVSARYRPALKVFG